MLSCCLVANGLASALVNPAQGAFTAVVTPMEKRGQAEGIRRQSADVVSLAGPGAALCDMREPRRRPPGPGTCCSEGRAGLGLIGGSSYVNRSFPHFFFSSLH